MIDSTENCKAFPFKLMLTSPAKLFLEFATFAKCRIAYTLCRGDSAPLAVMITLPENVGHFPEMTEYSWATKHASPATIYGAPLATRAYLTITGKLLIFGSQVHLPKHIDSGNLGYNLILLYTGRQQGRTSNICKLCVPITIHILHKNPMV